MQIIRLKIAVSLVLTVHLISSCQKADINSISSGNSYKTGDIYTFTYCDNCPEGSEETSMEISYVNEEITNDSSTASCTEGNSLNEPFGYVAEDSTDITIDSSGVEFTLTTNVGGYFLIPYDNPQDTIQLSINGGVKYTCDCGSSVGTCKVKGTATVSGSGSTQSYTCKDKPGDPCSGCCSMTVTVTKDDGSVPISSGPGVLVYGSGYTYIVE